ncbi:cytochrome P450 2F2-like [Pelobates cultripes]|uniref:Cytochrome P450 2F2-like n=1 Tax=Pelobates cultripes TaxID=61616 RepID=A0AAD1SX24_PELCU|nr:cytochrome P450 2F2-like [Pelobates cultripes]
MDGFTVTILLASFCVAYIIMCYVKIFKEKSTLPPGPFPLPLIGNLLQIDTNNIVTSMNKLKDKYGPVFTLYLGPNPGLVICGYKAVKEALIDQGDAFADRGDYPVFLNYFDKHDIGFTNGEKWKSLRRFALITLRNFGMGKKSIEERIQEEASFLIAELSKTKRSPTDLTAYFANTVSNVICSIVFGSRFDYKDKRLMAITNSINNNFRIMSSMWGTLYNMYPDLMDYLPGPHQRMGKNYQDITDIVVESIKYHEKTLDPNCPRDYIDCFLIKIMQDYGKDQPNPVFYKKSLLMSIHNLLFGGTETVSTTLRYGTLILMKYPEIAERMREEIDQVVGRNRSPSMEDRSKMPFTDATINEIMRFCDVIPLSLPRSTSRNTFYRGYNLPKGIYVTPFLTSVHRDPTQFAEPSKFNPKHFLDDKGCFKKEEALMPFAAGKRICPGENLARMELFIFFTSLLQNFNFNPTITKEEIKLEPIATGLGTSPYPYKASERASERVSERASERARDTQASGPRPLPIVGNLHQINTKDLVKSIDDLSKKFGSVFTIYLGPRPSVVLYGYKAVKEALVDQADSFSGRGQFPAVQRFTQGNGIAFSNGEKWKVLRRFALTTLRNFGMGKKSVEERIQEEAHFLLKELRKTKQIPFDPTFFLSRAVSNVICSIVFGSRFDYEDEEFLTLLGLINDNFQLLSSGWGTFYNIFPEVMNHLPGPHNRIFRNFEKMKLMIQEILKSHQETLQPDCPRDLIDCFLVKMQKEKENPVSKFNPETLIMTTLNLFFGGTETVSTTMRYGILILMKYPDIRERNAHLLNSDQCLRLRSSLDLHPKRREPDGLFLFGVSFFLTLEFTLLDTSRFAARKKKNIGDQSLYRLCRMLIGYRVFHLS